MKVLIKGLKQYRTIKTPCCNRKIKLVFPYGMLANYQICPYCFAHFKVFFSAIKSKRKGYKGKRAHKMMKKVLVE